MADNNEIRICLYHSDEQKPGYCKVAKIFTFGEVCEQADAFLKGLEVIKWGCSAYVGAEGSYNYSFQNRNNSKVPLDSKLLVVPKINSCGGYSIELLIQSGEKVTLAWSVKYLTDIETVWEISKNMSLAVYEGTFI